MRLLNEPPKPANVVALEFWKDFVPDGNGGQREIHKVRWAKRGDFQYHESVETVQRLKRPHTDGGAESPDPVWLALKPAYEAWLQGQETPVDGTALEAWPALTKRQVTVFRTMQYRAIEDIAAMTDSDIPRVRLPDVRKIRDMARAYIENKKGSAHIETAMADIRGENSELREQLQEALALLRQAQQPVQPPGEAA